MRKGSFRAVRGVVLGAAGVMVAATAVAIGQGAKPAGADTAPAPGVPATVSADALPTVQINGVVWSQATVGNIVYATGRFTRARPSGAAAGTQETVRNNLLAYDITTGNLITSFNHSLNAQGLYVTASPDGSRVYVGGDFTTVDGQSRGHLAAFDTATGGLVPGFAPSTSSTVMTIAATNTTVYVGGDFTSAGGQSRSRLAAFNPATGALLPWNPVANNAVRAMVMAPDQTRLVVGGQFTTLNGASRIGIGAVDPTAGANASWNPNFPVQDSGDTAWITHLSADANQIYGTAFYYTSGGNFEGRFAATGDGTIVWMNPCHGDSYASIPIGQVLYSVGHTHECSDMGDYTQDVQAVFDSTHHYAQAETTYATGTNRTPVITCCPRYFSFAGQPHGDQLNWYPTLSEGTFTGQSQAAWSVTGNANYVALGGEFPRVNGVNQQGLTRFAIRSIAPNNIAPAAAASLTPTAVSLTSGTARVTWQATSDQDNESLTYRLFRDNGTAPIHTTTVNSRFWYRPMIGFLDSQPVGSSHTYRVTATDPIGRVRTSGTSPAVTIGSGSLSSYAQLVRSDGAVNYWPLAETGGTRGVDYAGFNDLTYGSAVTHTAAGPGPTGSARAGTFDGTQNSRTASLGNGERRGTYSVEAWVRTASTTGGQIVGYGTYAGANSVNTDRTLYMDTLGRIFFGTYGGSNVAINSTLPYNDNQWHHVVGTVSPATGMTLYVDGASVASNPTATSTSQVSGYWRVGGDSLAGWPSAPTGQTAGYLNGSIASVAVYPTALPVDRVQAHSGGMPPPANTAPTGSFTTSCADLTCTVDGSGSSDPDGTITGYAWNFGDGTTGTGATASKTYAVAGTYTITLTVTDDDSATGSTTRIVSVAAPPPGPTTLASDTFNRTVSNGWGTADSGGAWTVSSNAANWAVTPGTGTIRMATAGAGTGTAYLGGVSARDVDVRTTVALDQMPTGNGAYMYVVTRRTSGTAQYRAVVRVTSTGAVTLAFTKLDGSSTETAVGAEAAVAGLTYAPGQRLRVRVAVTGASPTTLTAKVWADGATEPAGWQVSRTDTSALLANPGSVGFSSYLSGSATNAPIVQSVAAYTVTPA
jgi:hypothetical protein